MDTTLQKLDAAITDARERLERLLAARAVLAELTGEAAPPACGCHADRPVPKAQRSAAPKPSPTVATKVERQTRLARQMLAHGPMTFAQIRDFLGVSNDTVSKLVRSPWFAKDGGANSSAPWALTDAGRAVVTRTVAPPTDLRPNADLDDVFLTELRREMPSGKALPSPSNAGGEGTTPPAPVWRSVLSLLAEGPRPFTSLCRSLNVNPSSVGKAVGRLEAAGLIQKPGAKAGRSPWEITDRGREELTTARLVARDGVCGAAGDR